MIFTLFYVCLSLTIINFYRCRFLVKIVWTGVITNWKRFFQGKSISWIQILLTRISILLSRKSILQGPLINLASWIMIFNKIIIQDARLIKGPCKIDFLDSKIDILVSKIGIQEIDFPWKNLFQFVMTLHLANFNFLTKIWKNFIE